MEAKKSLVCKCGKQAKFIQMLTFSYHYCEACKDEVKDEPKKPGKVLGWDVGTAVIYDSMAYAMSPFKAPYGACQQPVPAPFSALPAGYVALKGEQVTCETCGHLKFFLPRDLPALVSVASPWGTQDERVWSKDISNEVSIWAPNLTSLDCVCARCNGGSFADRDDGTLHIKGRGWV